MWNKILFGYTKILNLFDAETWNNVIFYFLQIIKNTSFLLNEREIDGNSNQNTDEL